MNNKDGQTHKLRYRGTEIAPKSTVDVGHTGESLFCRVDTASLVDVRPKGHKPSIGFEEVFKAGEKDPVPGDMRLQF